MKNSTRSVAVFLLIVFFLIFNVTVVHTKPGAPPAGGVSGDPARSTCAFIGCHPGPELNIAPADLALNMGTVQGSLSPMTGQTYIPGQEYFIEFKPNMTNGNNTRYGFQTTALDPAGNMAGAFTITDATHNSSQNLLGRFYIGHKDASGFHDWNFKWTAPATNVGKVTFYYTVDDADNDGNTSGDKIYKGTTELLPNTGTGIGANEIDGNRVTVFPNPAKESVTVKFDATDNSAVELRAYSLDGRLVQAQTISPVNAGHNSFQVQLNPDVRTGVYLIELTEGNQKLTSRLMVE